jgi:large subunit ribosomal protein L7/L12
MATKSFEQIIDQIGGLTVLELAELVKGLEEKFGVTAAMPMAAAPAAGAAAAEAPKAEEKSEYKVTLEDAGPEKIKTIKALRTVTTLGLTEAKAKVEEGKGAVIADAASKEDAKKIKEALEAAGAKVTLS